MDITGDDDYRGSMHEEIDITSDLTRELVNAHDEGETERRDYIEAAGRVATALECGDGDCAEMRSFDVYDETTRRQHVLMMAYHLLMSRLDSERANDTRAAAQATYLLMCLGSSSVERIFDIPGMTHGSTSLIGAGERAMTMYRAGYVEEAYDEINDRADLLGLRGLIG